MVVAIISQAKDAGGRVRDTQMRKNKNREEEGEGRDQRKKFKTVKREVDR